MSPKVPKHWDTLKGEILNLMASHSWDSFSWGDIQPIDTLGLTQMLPLSEAEIVVNLRELVRDGDVIRENDIWFSINPELMKEYFEYIEYLMATEIEDVEFDEIQVPPIESWNISLWTRARAPVIYR
jgi:hypothetical protein